MRIYSRASPIRIVPGFSFFAVIGFLICTDREGVSLLCIFSCILHELGHLTVMLALNDPPYEIRLYGGGIHICGGSTSLPAVIAGCAVNAALFVLFGLIPWEQRGLRLFGAVNLLICLFNLIPVRDLDGKLLLDKLLLRRLPADKAVHVSEICERTASALILPAVVILVFCGVLNFSAIIFFFYLFAVEIFDKL